VTRRRAAAKSELSNRDYDLKIVASIASTVSLLFFIYYFQRGEILLYGDAVAHINISRRVFDSQTPGLLQLGTVWLPLPHLLTLPFLVSDWMWRTGVGGSIPSMIAYVLSVTGIFRLTRSALEQNHRTHSAARSGAWLAALLFGTNPNLLYLQSTAMTETLYLAFSIWAVTFFAEFLRLASRESELSADARRPLYRCTLCLAGAELTRYDGWFLAFVIGCIVVAVTLRRLSDRSLRRASIVFLLSIAAAPLLWLAYNAAVYGNALEFANGPYSAKAIEQRTAQPGYPSHPGAGNVRMAASFILKAAQLNMAEGNWGRIWIALALTGTLAAIMLRVRVVLLLWVPLAFYSFSIAYSGVPLFVPTWWPYTWYNLRYGLQLLPLFAVSGALAMSLPLLFVPDSITRKNVAVEKKLSPVSKLFLAASAGVILIIAGLSYLFVWKAQPLCFTEAWVNSRTKLALESSVARFVATLPPDSTYLMYAGDHVGVFQQAGIPLRQMINEGNHSPWKKPTDPQGKWEQALSDPAKLVDFVIGYEGDAVDQAVTKSGLRLLTEIHTSGQPRARIYAANAHRNESH
jgi:hypothetical protein